jgi:aspartate racemase
LQAEGHEFESLQVQFPPFIYDELCKGIVRRDSKEKALEIVRRFETGGAQAVILGCTEIGMLVQQSDAQSLLFDTTIIHAEAVDLAFVGL